MSRIIEGSLEILRPIVVGAVKGDEEWDDGGKEKNDDGPGEDEESFEETTDATGGRERAVINRKNASNEAKWDSKLQLLRKYRKQHGHGRVPQRYEIDGVKLGRWLNNQRTESKKHCNGMPSCITQEHIDQLEAIGVDWNPNEWQSKLELLRQYREQHGHCRVPRNSEKLME